MAYATTLTYLVHVLVSGRKETDRSFLVTGSTLVTGVYGGQDGSGNILNLSVVLFDTIGGRAFVEGSCYASTPDPTMIGFLQVLTGILPIPLLTSVPLGLSEPSLAPLAVQVNADVMTVSPVIDPPQVTSNRLGSGRLIRRLPLWNKMFSLASRYRPESSWSFLIHCTTTIA
jgi:hypothetical protein